MRLGLLVLCLTLGACTPSTSEPTGPASDPAQTSDQASAEVRLDVPEGAGLAQFSEFHSGHALTPAGGRALYWGNKSAHGIDIASGEYAWHTNLPEFVCATSPTVNADGLIAVMTTSGSSVDCQRISLLDSKDGSLLWSVDTPRPRQFGGDAIDTGRDTVVVTGMCGGYTTLDIADGSVTHEYGDQEASDWCPTAASDGDTIVLADDGEFQVIDAGTGERRQAPINGPNAQISDIVSLAPLVVTGYVYDSSTRLPGSLLSIGPRHVENFGRKVNDWQARPARYTAVDGTVWVESYSTPVSTMKQDGSYPKGTLHIDANPIGYDLRTHNEVGGVGAGGDATGSGSHLVGSIGTDVILAVDGEVRISPAREVENYEVVSTDILDAVVVGETIVSIDRVGVDGTGIRVTPLPSSTQARTARSPDS